MARTVDEILKEKKITLEEMEALKGIIEECREREKRINQIMGSLKASFEKLFCAIEVLKHRSELLSTSIESLNAALETLYLLSLPKEKFHRE